MGEISPVRSFGPAAASANSAACSGVSERIQNRPKSSPGRFPAARGGDLQSFTPSFDEIFDRLWRDVADLSRPKSGRVQNLTLEVPLTPEQARRGGNARIMVPARATCPSCRGAGGMWPYECLRCAGTGVITGELPVSVSFPPGLTRDHAVMIPLDRLGISDMHLTVLFRPALR
jgi:DnaJ-class molecular chaperone